MGVSKSELLMKGKLAWEVPLLQARLDRILPCLREEQAKPLASDKGMSPSTSLSQVLHQVSHTMILVTALAELDIMDFTFAGAHT